MVILEVLLTLLINKSISLHLVSGEALARPSCPWQRAVLWASHASCWGQQRGFVPVPNGPGSVCPLWGQCIIGTEANSFRAFTLPHSTHSLRPEEQGAVSKLTVWVVAVGIPSLTSVEANPIVHNPSSSKTTVGSSFYYGVTNSALGHPASSTHMETCIREEKWHQWDKSIPGKKLLFIQVLLEVIDYLNVIGLIKLNYGKEQCFQLIILNIECEIALCCPQYDHSFFIWKEKSNADGWCSLRGSVI